MQYDLEDLIYLVKQWGIDKGITGPNGTATGMAQAHKTIEEAQEILDGIVAKDKGEIIDGIGDTMVTLILQCELQDTNLRYCLQEAFKIISKRTGKMVDGQFVKD